MPRRLTTSFVKCAHDWRCACTHLALRTQRTGRCVHHTCSLQSARRPPLSLHYGPETHPDPRPLALRESRSRMPSVRHNNLHCPQVRVCAKRALFTVIRHGAHKSDTNPNKAHGGARAAARAKEECTLCVPRGVARPRDRTILAKPKVWCGGVGGE
eukprot:4162169-Prymnesium_polylepis.1